MHRDPARQHFGDPDLLTLAAYRASVRRDVEHSDIAIHPAAEAGALRAAIESRPKWHSGTWPISGAGERAQLEYFALTKIAALLERHAPFRSTTASELREQILAAFPRVAQLSAAVLHRYKLIIVAADIDERGNCTWSYSTPEAGEFLPGFEYDPDRQSDTLEAFLAGTVRIDLLSRLERLSQ